MCGIVGYLDRSRLTSDGYEVWNPAGESVVRPTPDVADEVVRVPGVSELLQPSVNVVPLQLFAYFVAVRPGADVDQPRNLAKSVTVE